MCYQNAINLRVYPMEAMVKIGKTTPDQVHIVFQDVEKSHWGVNGKLAGDPK